MHPPRVTRDTWLPPISASAVTLLVMHGATHSFLEPVDVVASTVPVEASNCVPIWALAPACSIEATPPVGLLAVSIPVRLLGFAAPGFLDVEELVVTPSARVATITEESVQEVAIWAF